MTASGGFPARAGRGFDRSGQEGIQTGPQHREGNGGTQADGENV